MRCAVLGFAIGVFWLQNQATLASALLIALLVLGTAVSSYLAHRLVKSRQPEPGIVWPSLLRLIAGSLAGFAWAALAAHFYLSHELPPEWEGRDITLIGTVHSLPHYFEQGVRFEFAVEQVLPQNGETPVVPAVLALAWYSGFGGREIQSVGQVEPGERWQLTVRLKRPHGSANPYGFDYEVWLLEQNLRATGYVRPDDKAVGRNMRLSPFVVSFGNLVERARSSLRARILNALPDSRYAGILVALVVGDQRAISQSDWKVFNRTGVSHLISISGLHVTMVAGLFASLMHWLWRHSFFTRAQLPLILPAPKVAALVGALTALLYVLLAGFGVPAQRTLYMLSVVALAFWLDRMLSVSHVLCAALAVVLLLDPWAVLAPGFWLSFGAVAIILYASVGRVTISPDAALPIWRRWLGGLKTASRIQAVVTLGLIPFTMLLFGQISLVSPVANAFAIPLVSLLITPLALVGSVLPAPLSHWTLELGHWLLEWLAAALEKLSALPQAVWSAPLPSPWLFALALAGTLWMLSPRGWPVRWAGLACWLPLLFNTPAHPAAGQMWLTAFDVGQGMALLIETEKHRLLYDSGPLYSPESDGGNRVLVPYLKARGVNALDGMIVTHSDSDHSGGALSVLQNIELGWVASSLWPDHPIVAAAPVHRRCEAGQHWEWDGVRFEMLHPTPESYANPKLKPNGRGCTLKITMPQTTRQTEPLSVLLPADIEAPQEAQLLARDAQRLKATVLLAPHHGSGTSSTEDFLQAVGPKVALFQVGYRNRYGHPKLQVYERYRSMGIERLRTDEIGAVTLRFGDQLSYTGFRQERPRYWHGH